MNFPNRFGLIIIANRLSLSHQYNVNSFQFDSIAAFH